MKWLKRTGCAAAVLLFLLATVPFFVSLNDYIPQIEQAAHERLMEPVRIEKMSLGLLPLPHVTIEGVSVGKPDMLAAARVVVTPDLGSLFGTPKVLRSVEVEKLVLTREAIDRLPQWAKTGTKEPAAVRVESIRLDNVVVKLAKLTIGPLDARLELTGAGDLASASIATQDGKLNAAAIRDRDRLLLDVSAKGWRLAVGPAVQFDELTAKGYATATEATFDEVRARLYAGSIAGKTSLRWEKGLELKGSLEVNEVEVRQLLLALGRAPSMSGRLTATPVFSANARNPEQIASVLRLATPFEVHGGVLHGMDIAKAATSLIDKDAAKGGETRFDRFSGHFALERGTRRLTKLNIVSGSLAAEGNVTISARDELSGRVNAKVSAGSAGSASVPLNVAGTLQSPLLYPTGGTVAGAALGAAVLGPAGAAIGAKAGQWAEGLFGSKERK